MNKVLPCLFIVLAAHIAQALPDHVLIGVRRDLPAQKQAIIRDNLTALGLTLSPVTWTNAIGAEWKIACYHTAQFKGKVNQQKLQEILDAVDDMDKVRIEFADEPRALLRNYGLSPKGSQP